LSTPWLSATYSAPKFSSDLPSLTIHP